ncbi:hypothetical protein ACFYNL_38040 [Streptomyces sp. NPDC007808]|uniref:hypothetical protein n=1 Tax=Streptomyces sp. NPDC007808 TaxID=3364779 RepID=UPI0036962D08
MPIEDLSSDPAEWDGPEGQLYRNAIQGLDTNFGKGDPRGGEGWPAERTVRAAAVKYLLTSPQFTQKITRLRLTGAKISGPLDLEACTLNATLELTRCHTAEVVTLEQVKAPAVYLEYCCLAGVDAAQLHTTNNFNLVGANCSYVTLTGAHIEGQVDMKHATIQGTERAHAVTLGLSSVIVGSDMLLRGINVTGEVNLQGARIGGQLNLRQGTLSFRGRRALKGLELETQSDALFEDLSVDGSVDLTGAVIGGSLSLNGASLHRPGKDPALDLARITVKQNVHCERGFTSEGMVFLAGATINGRFHASGGQFLHPSDTAIDASGIQVRSVILGTEPSEHEANRNGFRAEGTVILADAVINGTLDCQGGSITHPRPNKESLNAQGLKITRDLLLSEGFKSSGMVDLTGAEIGGRAVLTNGSFENAGRVAISARQIEARTSLLLQGGFLAHGKVDLSGARVDGPLAVGGKVYAAEEEALVLDSVKTAQDVEFEPGLLVEGSVCMRAANVGSNLKIIKPNLSREKDGVGVLNLEGTTVGGTLALKADTPVAGRIDLRQAKVAFLKDDPSFWPEENTMLAGFTYGSLSNFDSPDLDSRIKWLRYRGGYSAQPYQQLASVYKAVGRDDYARDVLYAGQKMRPRPHLFEKIWSWLLRLTVGYGYHPARVLYAVILLEVFGCFYFSIRRDDLRPSSALVSAYGDNVGAASDHLQPALYTLDLLLPVVTFGQRTLWVPEGPTSWVVTALMAMGWVLGGILVYGIGTAYQRRYNS